MIYQRCEWPGCAQDALCQSGNFGNKLVCADHFQITNGRLRDNNREALSLIAPGSRGKIGEIDILITQVHIEFNQVEYTVSWWDDGQRYSERVPAYEITSAEKTMHVGFK